MTCRFSSSKPGDTPVRTPEQQNTNFWPAACNASGSNLNQKVSIQMPAQLPRTASPTPRPTRRLKPEVAAKWAAQRRESDIQNLYQTPVEKLSPDDIARMKAAFFRG
jgi:hypothetical protein